jgi:hypothetical protein
MMGCRAEREGAVPQSSWMEWARTERRRSFFAASTEGSWTTQKGDWEERKSK